MMVISFRIDDCADQINKKPDLITEKTKNNYIRKYHSQKFNQG